MSRTGRSLGALIPWRWWLAFALLVLQVSLLLAVLAEANERSYSPPLSTPGLTCKAFRSDGTEMERSTARRCRFLRMVAANHPEWSDGRRARFRRCDSMGEVVNHIVPLECGGCDVPSNMELMSEAEWKGRTGPERYDCGRHPGGEW